MGINDTGSMTCVHVPLKKAGRVSRCTTPARTHTQYYCAALKFRIGCFPCTSSSVGVGVVAVVYTACLKSKYPTVYKVAAQSPGLHDDPDSTALALPLNRARRHKTRTYNSRQTPTVLFRIPLEVFLWIPLPLRNPALQHRCNYRQRHLPTKWGGGL